MLPPLKDVDKVIELSDDLWTQLLGPGGGLTRHCHVPEASLVVRHPDEGIFGI